MADLKLTFRDITEQKLIAWGAWSSNALTGLTYPSRSIMPETSGGLPIPPLSDEEALKIDRTILTLRKKNHDAFMFAIEHFQKKIPVYKTSFGKNRGGILKNVVIEIVQEILYPNTI